MRSKSKPTPCGPAVSPYRIVLFKRKLREIVDIPWLRFYWSKGRQHLVIEMWSINEECHAELVARLRRARIDLKLNRSPFGIELDPELPEDKRRIWSISIPIDQDALPEGKRAERRNDPLAQCVRASRATRSAAIAASVI